MKILSIVGARPQFVKEAIMQNEINKHPEIKEVVVHTGQHYDENMSEVFFNVLNMRKPDYNLGINSSSHSEMTALMMIALEKIMIKEAPNVVMLYGDTNSTLAGALVAAKLKIKIAHIEAGLRQNPKDMPEEINRVLTDHSSNFLFTPSKLGVRNLQKEGLTNGVFFVGDVMYDVYEMMKNKFDYDISNRLGLKNNDYIVLTLHRDFNVDNKDILKNILKEINRVSLKKMVVFPIHPRTKKRIEDFQLYEFVKNIKVIEPIDYLELMGLTQNAFKIITDSGGYQKEAYFAGKQAYIMMPDTGWKELVDYGMNKLVNYNNLYDTLFSKSEHKCIENIYGEGDSAKRIIAILKQKIGIL